MGTIDGVSQTVKDQMAAICNLDGDKKKIDSDREYLKAQELAQALSNTGSKADQEYIKGFMLEYETDDWEKIVKTISDVAPQPVAVKILEMLKTLIKGRYGALKDLFEGKTDVQGALEQMHTTSIVGQIGQMIEREKRAPEQNADAD